MRDQDKIEAEFFGPGAKAIESGMRDAALPSAKRACSGTDSDGELGLTEPEILAPTSQLDYQGSRKGNNGKSPLFQ